MMPSSDIKRLLDLFLISVTLPITVPLLGIVMAWSSLFVEGSPIFRQKRIGLNGRKFTMYKIRSMYDFSNTETHRCHVEHLYSQNLPMTKAAGEVDVIPGFGLLRKMGLDELPQLFNVLRGNMSIVGPRPCLPYEYEFFSRSKHRRFNTKPGLTGLWQVNGKNSLTFRQMNALDAIYTKSSNVLLDLAIILRTPYAIISQLHK